MPRIPFEDITTAVTTPEILTSVKDLVKDQGIITTTTIQEADVSTAEEVEEEKGDLSGITILTFKVTFKIAARHVRNIPTEDTHGTSASGIPMDLTTAVEDLITRITIQDMDPKEEVGAEEGSKIITMEDKKIITSTKTRLCLK